jgi:hypothetical protein
MRIRTLAFAGLVLASRAQAQEQPQPAASQPIVVEGVRDRNREIQHFVDALTEAPIGGQLSRFESSVCPAAVGLSVLQNDAIAQRMRRVAVAAGLRLGRAGCRPNALLMVVGDKTQFMNALYKKHPAYFIDETGHAKRPHPTPGPVASWHVEALLDSNGIPAAKAVENGVPRDYYITSSMDSSRLLPPTIPHFAAGVVVVELKALAGITTTQLADYAAMRIYARTDPGRLKNASVQTILELLDTPMGGAAPITLTSWDLAFLKALYSSESRQFANRQRSEMQYDMRRSLTEKEQVPQR